MPLENEAPKQSPRKLSEINVEYTALCAQAGQKQYQIDCAQADLKAINAALRKINAEASVAKQYEDAAPPAAAEPSNVTPISEGAPNG